MRKLGERDAGRGDRRANHSRLFRSRSSRRKDRCLIDEASEIKRVAQREAGRRRRLKEMAERGERDTRGGDRGPNSQPVSLLPPAERPSASRRCNRADGRRMPTCRTNLLACGSKGATRTYPSWSDEITGLAPFPAHRLAPAEPERVRLAPPWRIWLMFDGSVTSWSASFHAYREEDHPRRARCFRPKNPRRNGSSRNCASW